MKKIILYCLNFSVSILLTTIFFPANSNAQQDSLYRRDWACCHCNTWFKTEYLKPEKRQFMGLNKETLCPVCQKKLGDLQKALDSLRAHNRDLYELYKSYQQLYAEALEKLNAATERFWGKEAGGQPGWRDYYMWWDPLFNRRGFGGLNGSFGGFSNALLSLTTNFPSSHQQVMTHLTNGIAVYQSGGSVSPDGAMTWAGIYTDYIGSNPLINQFWFHKNMKSAMDAFIRNVSEGGSMQGAYANYNMETRQAYDDYMNNAKNFETAGKILDVIGFILSTRNLLNDLREINENKRRLKDYDKKMDSLSNLIWKNELLITCIRQTLDYQAGGSALKNRVPPHLTISLLGPAYLQKLKIKPEIYRIRASFNLSDTICSWDEYKLGSALNKLEQLNKMESAMNTIIGKLVPQMLPWALKDWQRIKPSVLTEMLKNTKTLLPGLLVEFKKTRPLAESIIEDLKYAITGYETEYVSDSNETEFIIASANNTNDTSNWIVSDNKKIKTGAGRVTLGFPKGVDWSLDFYTSANKFVTNRSSYSNHPGFYDITPGNYKFRLNTVPIDSVSVEMGKEIILKAGFVQIDINDRWELYDAEKKKYYTSGNKPKKMALPVGSYNLIFDDKKHRFIIKDKLTIKFEKPLVFTEQ